MSKEISATLVAACTVAVVAVAVLAEEFLRALGPVAIEDRYAGCRALGPAENPKLGPLPATAPDFSAPDLTGVATTLAAYRGKVVFLNFWQTDCPPCKEEAPSMERLQKSFGEDFVMVALASEQSFDPIRMFFRAGSALTVLLDPPDEEHNVGSISLRYGTEKWPETYLIDRDGRVRYYFINGRKWDNDNAHACVQALLNE